MSDLKSYLWNNPTKTSVKTRFNKQNLRLTEWPDFGFVGCPSEFIILSAFLNKKPLSYQQLNKMTACGEAVINHFLYVCHLLKILEVTEIEHHKKFGVELFRGVMGAKLKRFLFEKPLVKSA